MEQKFAKLALAATSLAIGAKAEAAITINEVYGGGGTTAAASYNADFVELYNNATVAVDLGGFSVMYASATGAFATSAGTTNIGVFPTGSTIPALGFFLISGTTSATNGGAALPAPDATSTINASATAGKIRLLDAAATVVDLVAYGSSATGGEGNPAPGLTITTSDSRLVLGVDSNNNSVDFITGTPSPMDAAASVPEPTTLGLTAAAGIALFIGRRRRKD